MTKFKAVETCTAVDFRVRITQLAEALSYMISLGSEYVIEPHVTLLLSPSTEDIYRKTVGELRGYLQNLPAIQVLVSRLSYERENRFLKVEVVGDNLLQIHMDLLTIIGKYRDGEIRKKDLQRIEQGKYNSEEIEHLREFGFLYSASRFNQKITLGRIPEGVDEERIVEKVRQILLPILGEKRKIEEVNLMFHTDAVTQAEMKELEFEVIKLK